MYSKSADHCSYKLSQHGKDNYDIFHLCNFLGDQTTNANRCVPEVEGNLKTLTFKTSRGGLKCLVMKTSKEKKKLSKK